MSKTGDYSLFIGRWMPPHKAHKALIDVELRRGHKVCIGLRKMPLDEDNPFTMDEVLEKWKELYPGAVVFPQEGNIVLLPMPNVGKVCHGRDPAWSIEKIQLSKELENISATKIRENMNARK